MISKLVRYNNFNDFFDKSFFDNFDALFPSYTNGGNLKSYETFPKCNIFTSENNNSVTFEFFVPGFAKEDININIEKDVMTVHGERSKDNQNRKRYITEFSDFRFHRTFAIPSNVNVEQVDAEYVNGILTVELPYLEKKEKTTRSISIR